ncbi:DEAD/DEAH box helicase [Actinokineospora sp. UTMC 2448]|uniref:DEAD/DEAH box helicase n=1 Tax=Actinokineospora sp. UTMC 2448 TaxID=2268449 RepID=UPI0021649AAD|nr:DEAD/DEAH box helicase [Actinokineospora sp. UTMC 2448]UVS78196.1 ATP-dependent helicase HepA [Actinokineospora sp. UTMC 2448]
MDRTERDALRDIVADLRQWGEWATAMLSWHESVQAAARTHEQRLIARAVEVSRAGQAAWQVVPLGEPDATSVEHLVNRANLPTMTREDRDLTRLLVKELRPVLDGVKPALTVRRFFAGSAKKQAAVEAGESLRRHHDKATAEGWAARIDELGEWADRVDCARSGLVALLKPEVGFSLVAQAKASGARMLERAAFHGLPEAIREIDQAVAGEEAYRKAATEAGHKVRQADVVRVLETMSVDLLKSATRDRIRLSPLTDAGVTTVREVLIRGMALRLLPGVGETSARRMIAAAETLRKSAYDEMPVRIDIGNRHPETTRLLARLAEWDACRRTRGAAADLERARELARLGSAIDSGTSHLLVVPVRSLPVDELREGIEVVKRRAELLRTGLPSGKRAAATADPWEDFLARPADYFAMLSELGFLTEDEKAAQGDLPEEIIQAVRDQALSGEHLTASLRGYQSFAARFALVQRKVVIGDEMGLGKTVEALAVLAHLRSRGESHFLVVCPAAVVTNWTREVHGKSKLWAYRIHGPDRDSAAKAWARDGGVAVTTFETLASWEPVLRTVRHLACVVVDEAHYIKNPRAQRTIRTNAILSRAERAVLLTGTPLENKVEEFRNLVSYLRPDLPIGVADLEPKAFRRRVAPVYLRRNQEDVLTELPELIQVDEWLPMSASESALYWEGVRQSNFAAMRQAAMLAGAGSQKLIRLVEIVREAEENQRRVIVFSHFRAVLDLVAESLPGPVFGPLTGSVASRKRQELVDQFSSAEHGAVLVAQIIAGGVGLNIQSASVVVICEPQLKPTTEEQAIARAHRMGQVLSVQVHRLLSEDSVDQRITEILARKKRIFDEFARVSDTADSTPDAVDLTEAELVREVLEAERRRLAGRPQR